MLIKTHYFVKFLTQKNEDSGVELLLKNVLHYSSDMNVDELSVCFMYLTKLSVPMQTDVMTTILELILKFVKNGNLLKPHRRRDEYIYDSLQVNLATFH